MTFRDLGLSAPILTALKEQGYQKPSPIQGKAIPPALAGRDVLGIAQTGTGKTCAFATPILQRLAASTPESRPIRALILTPTRELAIQIGESFEAYGKHLKLRHTVIFGGVGQNPQVEALKKGVDILVATPGRLMDLYNQKLLTLDLLEIFVLDEADRMLDMGFIHDVKKILKWLPREKQTMLFSATMPPEITDLVNSLLKHPVRVAVDPVSSPVEAIRQSVCHVDKGNKTRLLAHLMEIRQVKNALVFTRTKHGANKVARDLVKEGISAAAIHGNKSQTARQQALSDFKAGRIRTLVATDIAARGLDIEELSHVFNYNLPEVPETYVHRIGRTGRAGRGGEAIAFCDFTEQPLLKDIEKLIGRSIPVWEDHPFPMQVFEAPKRDKHGKIINEEDAEARQAARELKRQREEAKQAAAREKRQAEQAKQELAAQVLTQSPVPEELPAKKKRKKKKKAAPAQEAPKAMEPILPEEEPAFDYLPSRPKAARPGTLLHTGDAMPNTEFRRPSPLDSDVIMDATARLLAPRKLTLSPSRPQPTREEPRQDGKRSRKQKKEEPPAPIKEEPKEAAPAQKKRKKKKAAAAPAAAQSKPASVIEVTPELAVPSNKRKKKKSAAPSAQGPNAAPVKADPKAPSTPSKKRKKKSGSRRTPSSEPRKQLKDSTEQPSLMKPFYLDFGR